MANYEKVESFITGLEISAKVRGGENGGCGMGGQPWSFIPTKCGIEKRSLCLRKSKQYKIFWCSTNESWVRTERTLRSGFVGKHTRDLTISLKVIWIEF